MGNSHPPDFYDIQTEYKEFINQISSSQSYLYYTIKDLKIFLESYCKLKNTNEVFIDNLRLYLAELENVYEKLTEIIEITDNTPFHNAKQPQAKIYNIENYINIPDDYEQDIYVDPNYPIDFSKLFENKNDT